MAEKAVILIRETTAESLWKDATTCAVFVVLIGLGWWIDSNAMQWFGGVLAFLFAMGRASVALAKATCTVAEARARLDKMEQ